MKKERGITLVTLIISIIAMIIVIAILSIISENFYSNKKLLIDNSKNVAEYNKFNMFFIEDVKKNSSATIDETDDKVIITFGDRTIYTYVKGQGENSDNGIYRNKVKICSNISSCHFDIRPQKVNNTEKQIITVEMAIETNGLFITKNDYVLKYW